MNMSSARDRNSTRRPFRRSLRAFGAFAALTPLACVPPTESSAPLEIWLAADDWILRRGCERRSHPGV